jgi:hypothetical protein
VHNEAPADLGPVVLERDLPMERGMQVGDVIALEVVLRVDLPVAGDVEALGTVERRRLEGYAGRGLGEGGDRLFECGAPRDRDSRRRSVSECIVRPGQLALVSKEEPLASKDALALALVALRVAVPRCR